MLELWCLEHLFYKVRASTPENLENGISFSNHEEVGYFDQKNWKTFTWLRSGLPCVKSVPIRLWERLSLG